MYVCFIDRKTTHWCTQKKRWECYIINFLISFIPQKNLITKSQLDNYSTSYNIIQIIDLVKTYFNFFYDFLLIYYFYYH